VSAVVESNPVYRARRRRNTLMMGLAALALAFGLFWLIWIRACCCGKAWARCVPRSSRR